MISTLNIPRFCKGQRVGFIGGTGTIKKFQLESGSWSYLVEMELGPEPLMGRVGSETMIWLPEADLLSPNERHLDRLATAGLEVCLA